MSKYTIQEILNAFMSDKPRKKVFGCYRIDGASLVYESTETHCTCSTPEGAAENVKSLKERGESPEVIDQGEKISRWQRYKVLSYVSNEIARKLPDGTLLGNSSILPLVGRTVAYGHVHENRSETEIQRAMTSSGKFIMIPFTVFEQAKLDLNKFKMIEKGPEETAFRTRIEHKNVNGEYKHVKIVENQHFTGASLFSVDGKAYLFDIDRREQEHKIFNPFLSEVTGSPKTIAEAYELLKPKAVKDAERKGLKVLRQGEWFLIPTKAPKLKKLTAEEKALALVNTRFGLDNNPLLDKKTKELITKKALKIQDSLPKPTELRAGQNRPNTVERGLKVKNTTYVTGVMKHSGREHADLKLEGWYIPVANTAIKSVTITGDID